MLLLVSLVISINYVLLHATNPKQSETLNPNAIVSTLIYLILLSTLMYSYSVIKTFLKKE